MKNLKRILSLALACTMLVGMMVVGASAADFADAKDIEHLQAVETLVALGAISGNGDGTFDPQGTMTRAAMAKMLAWVMNKGKDPTFADTDEPTFTDVDTPAYRWAIPYIEYCYQLGYVNGDGGKGSTFRPQDPVKSTEFARALLNAMGYKLDSNENWELKTEVQAREEGIDLYTDLDDAIAGKAMNRDNAMQMFYNALYAPMANATVTTANVYYLSTDGNGTPDKTHGYFDTAADARAYAEQNKIDDATIVRGTRTETETLGQKYLGLVEDNGVKIQGVTYSKGIYTVGIYSTDIDLTQYMGQEVTFLYKLDKDGDPDVYGVVPEGAVRYTGLVGDIDASALTSSNKKIKLGGTTYNVNSAGIQLTIWNEATPSIALDATEGYEVYELTAIANGSSIDTLIAKPVYVTTATVYRDGTVTLDNVEGATRLDPDDENIAEDVYDGAWIIATQNIADIWTVELAPVVESVRFTKNNGNGTVVIGGKTYKDPNGVIENGADGETPYTVGSTYYDLVAYKGYLFDMYPHNTDPGRADLSSVVYVTKVAEVADRNADKFAEAEWTVDVKIWTQDNEPKTITVTTVDGENAATNQTSINTTKLKADTLYVMSEEDGEITLTSVATANLAVSELNEGDASAEGKAIADGKLDGVRISANAVIFVKIGSTVTCLPGSTVAGWEVAASTFTAGSEAYTELNKSTNFTYVTLGILLGLTSSPDGTASGDKYGYITADVTTEYLEKGDEVSENGTYYRVTIWDGETEDSYLTKTAPELETPFVKFQTSGKTLVSIESLDDVTPDAITKWDGTDYATNSGKTGTVTAQKHYVIFIDSANQAAPEKAGVIDFADIVYEENIGTYVNNVYFVKDGDITILYVDVNNEIPDQGSDEEEEPLPAITDAPTVKVEAGATNGLTIASAVTLTKQDSESGTPNDVNYTGDWSTGSADTVKITAEATGSTTISKIEVNGNNFSSGNDFTLDSDPSSTGTKLTIKVTVTEEGKAETTFIFLALVKDSD